MFDIQCEMVSRKFELYSFKNDDSIIIVIPMPHTSLLILLLLLLLTPVLSCPTSYYYPLTDCTFTLSYTDSQCLAFHFQHCSFKQCANTTLDASGNSQCSDYVVTNYSTWSACTQRCCNPSQVYSKDANGLQQCQNDLTEKENTTLVIALSVFGGTVFLTIVIFIICLCRRKQCTCYLSSRQCCRTAFEYSGMAIITLCHWTRNCILAICKCIRFVCLCGCCEGQNSQEKTDSINQPTIEIASTSSSGTVMRPMWRSGGVNQKLSTSCGICLEPSPAPSLVLDCGHAFHRECIIMHIRTKEQQCLSCGQPKFKEVLVYCEQCYAAYYQVNLLANIHSVNSEKQVCDVCQTVNMHVVTEKSLT